MKIADFFIALGFEVKGKEDVEKVDQAVGNLEFKSLKLLAGVTALNAAFYAMIAKAVEAGVTLQKFALTTGLSTDELQRWQLTAVRGNVAAASMAQALGAIQKARAAIAFGNAEAAAPWMLLGIDPRQDPFKVLEQLRQQVLKLDPAIARQKLSEMGFSDDILYLMRQPGFGRGNLAKNLTVSPEEATNLAKLGSAWREFLFTLGQFATRFSAQFAEPLAEILKQMTRFLALGGRFVNWLEGGTIGARYMMYALLGLLVVVTGLGIALGILALGPVGAFVGLLAIMAIALGGLVLLIQDFWVACRGGKSAFDWNDGLLLTVQNVERLAHAMQWAMDVWEKFQKKTNEGKGLGWSLFKQMNQNSWDGDGHPMFEWHRPSWMGGGDTTQTNHINVTVPAAGDAHATGAAVGRSAARQISDAYGQMPLPSK